MLLFLGRTGARVSEALGINVCDLDLDRARPQVLLRGKGRKERIVPIANDLARALRAFMRERGLKSHEEQPLFVGTHGERLTRFGATHIVRRVVAAATLSRPELASKSFRRMSCDTIYPAGLWWVAATGKCKHLRNMEIPAETPEPPDIVRQGR
nr:tyrosine-type recombinase/integrase [Rhizobium sp. T1473]MCA0804324.1 tyrosine-type recombinase/integrase [Rhizobium sp. T1473]